MLCFDKIKAAPPALVEIAGSRTCLLPSNSGIDTMNPDRLRWLLSRRTFLGRAGGGLGALAFASLVDPALGAKDQTKPAVKDDRWPGVIRTLHTPARAKRVIWLYMAGGMSHLETFDHK